MLPVALFTIKCRHKPQAYNKYNVVLAVRAQGVLTLLRSLLERFPSSSSVRAAITALTAIAADTVVHVPDQVIIIYHIVVCTLH
jgi:hypothetical protein